MRKLFIALILFASCTEGKKKLEISPAVIELGNVVAGDTAKYKINLRNTSLKDNIHIKGISSNCTCAIVESDSFCIPPLCTKVLRGKYIGKKEDSGKVSQRIAIHSDADSTFQFVTINANVK